MFLDRYSKICSLLKKGIFTILIAVGVIGSSVSFSAPPVKKIEIPEQITGATLINSEGLIELSQSHNELIVIDSRITEDRSMGYIENSLSLPDIETNCNSLKEIISSMEIPLVFYCNGPKCGRSVIATRAAVQCGYKVVYWFRGGFAEWKDKDYPYEVK